MMMAWLETVDRHAAGAAVPETLLRQLKIPCLVVGPSWIDLLRAALLVGQVQEVDHVLIGCPSALAGVVALQHIRLGYQLVMIAALPICRII